MSSRTISLHEEAYRRLRAAKRSAKESFTQVVLRAVWPDRTLTGRDLLERVRRDGAVLPEETLAAVEEAKGLDRPPGDKWKKRR